MALVVDRLKSQLLASGLQHKDQVLFQVINQLIDAVKGNTQEIIDITGGGGGGGTAAPFDATYLTVDNEVADLPNSRRELAGAGIQMDDSAPNVRTVDNLLHLLSFWTKDDDNAVTPNSRRVVAGTGITLDYTVAGDVTINSSAGVFVEWSVLTNGDPTSPELIFAGGDVIMTHVP